MNKKRSILIAEDEVSLAEILKAELESAGFKVSVAYDGKQAIGKMKKDKFDLLLLDLIMPVLDGFGVMTKMKDLSINVPIIILSNLGQQKDVKKALSFGAITYFVKSDIIIAKVVEEINNIKI
jgi:two-component system, OmpR family, response regulator VicR